MAKGDRHADILRELTAPRKVMLDLGVGEAEYGSGFKLVCTPRVTVETEYCDRHRTPFQVGKKYHIYAIEIENES